MHTCGIDSDDRASEAYLWVRGIRPDVETIEIASSDASFRRYLRLRTPSQESYVIMDAPPSRESVDDFLAVAEIFESGDVRVPSIYAYDKVRGFVLLEDLGQQSFFDLVSSAPFYENRLDLYKEAINVLFKMRDVTFGLNTLPVYDHNMLKKELLLFTEWYTPYIGVDIEVNWLDLFDAIADGVANHPLVLVHRDFHSRNMMINRQDIVLIDFQDAVRGSAYYDLVSLLRDAYTEVDKNEELELLKYYYDGVSSQLDSFEYFFRCYQLVGLQRHLKILGIFVRLFQRDGKSQYLPYLPRVLDYAAKAILDLFGCSNYSDALSAYQDKQEQKLLAMGG